MKLSEKEELLELNCIAVTFKKTNLIVMFSFWYVTCNNVSLLLVILQSDEGN